MNKVEEIKKKIRDLKLKQKMTTGRLEWNDIQREIDILNNELKATRNRQTTIWKIDYTCTT